MSSLMMPPLRDAQPPDVDDSASRGCSDDVVPFVCRHSAGTAIGETAAARITVPHCGGSPTNCGRRLEGDDVEAIQSKPGRERVALRNESESGALSLPPYQSRQSEMMRVLYEFETVPRRLVSGYIREIGALSAIVVPSDLVKLCFEFVQHPQLAALIDSKGPDELYSTAWEATERGEYLLAEQLIGYLLGSGPRRRWGECSQSAQCNGWRCSRSEWASTLNLMAVVKYFVGDVVAAERFLVAALSLEPRCDVIHNNYAVLLVETGRLSAAEREMVSAVGCNPRSVGNHRQLASILFCCGKFAAAAAECELVLGLEAEPSVESRSGFAWLLEQCGRFEEAQEQYLALIALEPGNASWYFWSAVLLQRIGRLLPSTEHFAQCIRRDPQLEGANGRYAYSLWLAGEAEAARKFLAVALAVDGDHCCVHYFAAVICCGVQTAVNELHRCRELLRRGGGNQCRHEKGCLLITENDVTALLRHLGFG